MKHLPLLLLLSFPLFAQNNEVSVSYGSTTYSQVSESMSAGVSYNRFWTRYVSTRAGIIDSRKELPDDHGERRFTAVHGSVEYHPFRGRLLSPRLAAGVAHASSNSDVDPVDDDSQITVIAGGGVDFNLTRRFALGVEMLYLPFTPNSRERFAARLDPKTYFASARFRW